MRRLWISREKASAARFTKMQVYIEDREEGDTLIGDVPCRKLGAVKNGQQKHFNIETEAAKVFVLADKSIGKNHIEFARIPEGEDDVFLSGKNVSLPFGGKPFRFDGMTDEEVLHNRKKAKRKGILILTAVILAVLLVGAAVGAVLYMDLFSLLKPSASAPETEAKAFWVDNMGIMLTDEFTEDAVPASGYEASFSGPGMAVFVKRESFTLAEGLYDMTPEEYAALVLMNNGLDSSVQLEDRNGEPCFVYTYTGPETGKAYEAYTVVKKGADAFWMVQFSAPAENAENCRNSFAQWADTVTFVSE